jgi:hypothetical protein
VSRRVSAYLRRNVLGLVAIFLALSAGAYAVQKAPKNSVVSKSIKDGQVQNPDLGPGAVSADKLGAGAVGSDKLAAGAVAADKLAPGSVSSAALSDGVVSLGKLGFNPATQDELEATVATAASGLSTPGTINQAGNPVDWTKLKGVPDGLADGLDRLFGLAATDASGDTTPSVANLSVLSIASAGAVAITDLEEGTRGQVITLHDLAGGGAVTITDAAPFVLSANWAPTDGDTLTLARVAADLWVEVSRSAN